MIRNKDYFIEQYSHEALTVSLDAKVPTQSRCIADLRLFYIKRQIPQLPRMDLMPAILSLHQLGCDYIDIGFHTDWIAAEIPIYNKIPFGQFEKIITILRSIKESLQNSTSVSS